MNMLDNFFMGILSCEKYKERRVKQDLSQTIFDYMYFVGDSNLSNPIVGTSNPRTVHVRGRQLPTP